MGFFCFFFQAEDGIRYLVRSRGLGDVYKRQELALSVFGPEAPDPTELILGAIDKLDNKVDGLWLSLIHI